MIDSKTLKIDKFSFTNVSRETLVELEDYSKEVITRNRTINLISKNTEKSFKIKKLSPFIKFNLTKCKFIMKEVFV